MFRTTTAILALTLLAGAAHADDYKVSLSGKSPAEIQTAIANAASKACRAAYLQGGPLDFWSLRDVKDCEQDAAQTAQAQANAILSARAGATATTATR